jgi:hypothetical protein
MKTKKSIQKPGETTSAKKRFFLPDGRGYIEKMQDGFYKAFREDGSEITGVNLPINIALMALRGVLLSFVKIYPSDEEIEIEPSLKILRDQF